MDIDKLEELFQTHEVPSSSEEIIELVKTVYEVDVTSLFQNGDNKFQHIIKPDADQHNALCSYYGFDSYYASGEWIDTASIPATRHRWTQGSFISYWERYISRKTEPFGLDTIPYRLIFDERLRFDYSSKSDDSLYQHIRVQRIYSLSTDLLYATTAQGGYRVLAQPAQTLIDLVANGWEIIYRDETPIGAMYNVEYDPDGTQLIVFSSHLVDFDESALHISDCLYELSKNRETWAAPAKVELSDEIKSLVELLKTASSINESSSNRISELNSSISNWRTHIASLSERLANAVRGLEDSAEELKTLESARSSHVIKTLRAQSEAHLSIAQMRPVKKAEIHTNTSGSILKFETYPFGMRVMDYEGDREAIVEIPPIEYEIDISGSDAFQSIRLYSGGIDEVVHPHALNEQGRDSPLNVCWGNAARRIAEAWGRRDWISLVRLCLAWQTQYNDESPYNDAYTLCENLPHIETQGWLTQEAATPTGVTA